MQSGKTNYEMQKNNIVEYVSNVKPILASNSLKGMEGLNLLEDQMHYYNRRIEYFISLIQEDKKKQLAFLGLQDDYYKKFPENSKKYFYWSRDIFDQNLMMKIQEKFGKIELPYELLNTFYQGTVIEK